MENFQFFVLSLIDLLLLRGGSGTWSALSQMFNLIFYLNLLHILVTEGAFLLSWGW